jgi:hypothetical protein
MLGRTGVCLACSEVVAKIRKRFPLKSCGGQAGTRTGEPEVATCAHVLTGIQFRDTMKIDF